jgi:transcriptional regulator with XRE-family HTH domain
MVCMDDKLTLWLSNEINERGWSIREVSRRAGISHTTVAQILSGHRAASAAACIALARALRVPSEDVLRRAGLLPDTPVDDFQVSRLYDYYKRLSPRAREDAVQYLVFKYEQEHPCQKSQ